MSDAGTHARGTSISSAARVGGRARVRDRLSETGDAEDPAAVRHEPVAVAAVPAWKTSAPAASAASSPAIVVPAVAVARDSRSAATTTVTAAPARHVERDAGEIACRRAGERPEQVAVDEREHGLRLGIAEAAVELEHARPVRGQHQPGEEQADERRAALVQAPRERVVDVLDELVDLRRREARYGAYEPMPPVFGPSSPSYARLKSCGGRARSRRRPSQIAKSDTSGPSSSSSIDDVAAESRARGGALVELRLACGTRRRPCRRRGRRP